MNTHRTLFSEWKSVQRTDITTHIHVIHIYIHTSRFQWGSILEIIKGGDLRKIGLRNFGRKHKLTLQEIKNLFI